MDEGFGAESNKDGDGSDCFGFPSGFPEVTGVVW